MHKYGGKITDIQRQKRHKNRVSIFIDDEFAFGLDVFLANKYHLKKGDVLHQQDVEDLLYREERKRVLDKAYDYLARRSHSQRELTAKLNRKGFEKSLIQQVVDELKAAGHLDDLEFARSFARNRLAAKSVGKRYLSRELAQRGVNKEMVDTVLDKIYSDVDETDLATTLARKRLPRYEHLEKLQKRKRLSDFLCRRGFDWETIKQVLESIL